MGSAPGTYVRSLAFTTLTISSAYTSRGDLIDLGNKQRRVGNGEERLVVGRPRRY